MMAAKLTDEERWERIKQAEREELAALADHPNPAITVWRMLPGHNYGAVFETTKTGKLGKLLGYEIRTAGESKFMPVAVARRLVKDGKCSHRLLGDMWIAVNKDWQPKIRKSARS